MLLQQDWLLLADFGIAKLLDSSTGRDRTHAGAGTPEYMAPEQAQGHAVPASDRYSLAIVAYQLLTGKVPFKGETPYDTLLKQIRENPPAPRQLNPRIPQPVEEALLKGLAKQAEERPSSCIAFVEALEQGWRQGALAKADPDATILAPWSKRPREAIRPAPPLVAYSPLPIVEPPRSSDAPTALATGTPLPSAPDSSATPWSAPLQSLSADAQRPRPDPEDSVGTGLASSSDSLHQQQRNDKIGRRELLIGALPVVAAGSLLLTSKMLSSHASKPHKTSEQSAPGPHRLITGIPLLKLAAHQNWVRTAAWDPSGRYLATGSEDTHVMLWDVGALLKGLKGHTGNAQTVSKPLQSWKFSSTIYNNSLAWSGDGRYLAVTPIEIQTFYVIDTKNPDATPEKYTDTSKGSFDTYTYSYVATKPGQNTFAIGEFPGQRPGIGTWNVGQAQKPFHEFTYPNQDFINFDVIAWSFNGSQVATVLNDFRVFVWDVAGGTLKHKLSLPQRTAQQSIQLPRSALVWSPTNAQQLVTSDIDIFTVWDVQHEKVILSLGTDDPDPLTAPQGVTNWIARVSGLTWSPNGRYIAGSYGRSRRIYIWDMYDKAPRTSKDGLRLQHLMFPDPKDGRGHHNTIVDMTWSPDGRYIATTSYDNTAVIWQVDAS